jgi:hypothetical protein
VHGDYDNSCGFLYPELQQGAVAGIGTGRLVDTNDVQIASRQRHPAEAVGLRADQADFPLVGVQLADRLDANRFGKQRPSKT